MSVSSNGIERWWKPILGLTALSAVVLIGILIWHQENDQPEVEAAAAPALAEQIYPEANSESAYANETMPSDGETWRAPAETVSEGPFANSVEYGYRRGYYRSDSGSCTSVIGKDAWELARDLEDSLGRRYLGFSGFADGMIVEFRNGSRTAVWGREIDCKDPPYNPLANL